MANYSNNVNSNNVTNNFTIIPLGRENVSELLTLIEKKEILKSKFSCLESVVDLIHCGKYDQYKNIIITNLKMITHINMMMTQKHLSVLIKMKLYLN